MKLNKREVCAVLERDYITLKRTLGDIAQEFSCSPRRISQIGKDSIAGWCDQRRNGGVRVAREATETLCLDVAIPRV